MILKIYNALCVVKCDDVALSEQNHSFTTALYTDHDFIKLIFLKVMEKILDNNKQNHYNWWL